MVTDGETRGDIIEQNKQLNARVVRKLDFILLPFLSIFFLASSLDRSNVGNAESANFTQDAGLAPEDLNTSVAIFFAVFVSLQPLGSALGRKYGMVRFVPSCMLIWGLCTALHIWVKNKWELILLRTVIGVLEAGFYPVTVSYMSMFYTRYEFAKRLAVFYGQSAIAGAIGGLLSYAVFSIFPSSPASPNEWKPWQVLFCIEGASTMIIALAGFFFLPHGPEHAWFFTKEEKAWAGERILEDRHTPHPTVSRKHDTEDGADNHEEVEGLLNMSSRASIKTHVSENPTTETGLSSHDVLSALTSWHIWWLLFCNILSAVPVASFSVFLPLIVRGLTGSDPSSASLSNLLSVPPFMVGAFVLFAFAIYSDKTQARLKPILYGLAILLAGLTGVVMLPHGTHGDKSTAPHGAGDSAKMYTALRYLAMCVMVSGSFVASPLTVTWLSTNTPSPGKRAIILGINGWGNFAGVIGAQLFSPRYAPDYVVPFFVTLGCVGASFIGFAIFRNLVVAGNESRRRVVAEWTEQQIDEEEHEGDVPVKENEATVVGLALKRGVAYIVAWLMKEGVDYVDDKARRGDEKMTFMYSL
jgi:MFS family permease